MSRWPDDPKPIRTGGHTVTVEQLRALWEALPPEPARLGATYAQIVGADRLSDRRMDSALRWLRKHRLAVFEAAEPGGTKGWRRLGRG